MATKTVVCPECGTSAAPGRYACAECGTLLASVAPAPRSWSDGGPGVDGSLMDEPAGSVAEPALAEADASLPSLPAASEPQILRAGAAVTTPAYLKVGRPRSTAPPADLLPHAEASVPFDEDAPIGSAGDADELEPDVLHVPVTGPADLATEDLAATGVAAPDVPRVDATPDERAGPDDAAPAAEAPEPAADAPESADAPPFAGVPGWPPPDDPGIATPAPLRTPAGSYLPPSAVQPAFAMATLAAPSAVVGATAAAPLGAVAPVDADRGSAAWADRGSAALSGALDVRISGAASRRTIVGGAGLVAIGLFLPWVNGLPSEGPFAGYLERWGMAGPGMWLVFLGLVVLAIVAGSAGRAESWPIGLPAAAAAAFVGGLLWPYLVSGSGRSIGVWVVLLGAIVLAIGGILDRRVRHAVAEPVVPHE